MSGGGQSKTTECNRHRQRPGQSAGLRPLRRSPAGATTPANPKAIGELTVASERHGDRQLLMLSGELDLTSAEQLTRALARACKGDADELVLDVGGLTFIDSTGLRAILNGKELCEESDCAFSLAPDEQKVLPQVRRLLEVTGLLSRLPFRAEGASGGDSGG
jgi:anti-anti-sigma factor